MKNALLLKLSLLRRYYKGLIFYTKMEFRKEYLYSPDEFERTRLHSFKSFLPQGLVEKSSKKHLELFQMRRWKYLRGRKKVLDVGCSIGNFIKFNPYGTEVWGMDLIKEIVTELKKQGLNVKQGDLNKKIPFEKDSFDGVICSHVFEHILDPTKAISEIKRVLKDKGILVLTTPNLSFKKFYDDYTHVKPYTKKSLYKLLKNNGFEKIRIENGPCMSPFLSALFFFFPKTRFSLEKLFGKVSPFELTAIALNRK